MARLDGALDCPVDQVPEPEELIEAAMQWHFDPQTGSAFWLERAKTLGFDPRKDVRTLADLRLFPNVINEMRYVRVEDLIPRGYGSHANVVGVFESGGTTGSPKRVVLLADWMHRLMAHHMREMDARHDPRDVNWLSLGPSGPHIFGEIVNWLVRLRGGIRFTVDMDPRWAKQCIRDGRAEEADRYAEHLIDQSIALLETQNIAVMMTTPPLLERMARRDDLVALINDRLQMIVWAGAHMDADTRDLFQSEIFPDVQLRGTYGSTMILGTTTERAGLTRDDPWIVDPFSPYISFSVVDPGTKKEVPYGERGQVVMNHVSKSALLPNNLERDMATRIEPPPGQAGDSVADVQPVLMFENETVIEGVY